MQSMTILPHAAFGVLFILGLLGVNGAGPFFFLAANLLRLAKRVSSSRSALVVSASSGVTLEGSLEAFLPLDVDPVVVLLFLSTIMEATVFCDLED